MMVAGPKSNRSYLSSTERIRHRIGPKDSGRLMTLEDFQASREKPGYVYELIDGVLNVSPSPQPLHEVWKEFVVDLLKAYAHQHPDRINFVATDCDVVIPGRPGATRPRPDVAAYQGFPREQVLSDTVDWEDLCPVLVVEIISRRRPRKDTNRNRQLYWMAGGIAEYWIIDPRKDVRRPALTALRRRAGQAGWDEASVPAGGCYTCELLPGLTVDLAQ